MALGVQTKTDQVRALMIALSFHQAFEGFALGVAVVHANLKPLQNLLMVAIFSITTPAGIAIGLIISHAQGSESKRLLSTQVLSFFFF